MVTYSNEDTLVLKINVSDRQLVGERHCVVVVVVVVVVVFSNQLNFFYLFSVRERMAG